MEKTLTLKQKQRRFWEHNINPITGHRDSSLLLVSNPYQNAEILKPNTNCFKSMIV